jgi:hypothetical protein
VRADPVSDPFGTGNVLRVRCGDAADLSRVAKRQVDPSFASEALGFMHVSANRRGVARFVTFDTSDPRV